MIDQSRLDELLVRATNRHLNGPPLLVAATDGATPFRLNLHHGDVGHTLIVGLNRCG